MDLIEAFQFRKHLSELVAAAWIQSGATIPLYTWFDVAKVELPRPRIELELSQFSPAGMLIPGESVLPRQGYALPRLWRGTANFQVIHSCQDIGEFERQCAEARLFCVRLGEWTSQVQQAGSPLVLAGVIFQGESSLLDLAQDLATSSIELELHFSIKPNVI